MEETRLAAASFAPALGGEAFHVPLGGQSAVETWGASISDRRRSFGPKKTPAIEMSDCGLSNQVSVRPRTSFGTATEAENYEIEIAFALFLVTFGRSMTSTPPLKLAFALSGFTSVGSVIER